MTDYEKLLEETARAVLMPPPREPGRCDGDVSCPECDRDGYARCGLEHDHDGDHMPFADVYEQGLRDMIGKLAAALREVMAENACDACGGTGKPVSGLTCMCGGTGKMSVAAPVLRLAAVQASARAEAALADVEAMRAVVDAADGTKRMLDWMLVNDRCGIETMGAGTRAAVEGSAGRLRDALHALDARATPSAKETKP